MKYNASYRKHRFMAEHRQNSLRFFASSSPTQLQKKPIPQNANIALASSTRQKTPEKLFQKSASSSHKLLYFLLLTTAYLTKAQPLGDFLFFQIRDKHYALTCVPDIEASTCYNSAAQLKEWLVDNDVQEKCGFQFTNITTEGDKNSVLLQKPIFGLGGVDVCAVKNTSRAMTPDLQCMQSRLQGHAVKITLITFGIFYAFDAINMCFRARESYLIVPTAVVILLPFFLLGDLIKKIKRHVWPQEVGHAAVIPVAQVELLSEFTSDESDDRSRYHSEIESPVAAEDPELAYGSMSPRGFV